MPQNVSQRLQRFTADSNGGTQPRCGRPWSGRLSEGRSLQKLTSARSLPLCLDRSISVVGSLVSQSTTVLWTSSSRASSPACAATSQSKAIKDAAGPLGAERKHEANEQRRQTALGQLNRDALPR